jgi:O-antigen ligase
MNPAGYALRLAACVGAMAFALSETFLAGQFRGLLQVELLLWDVQWAVVICLSIWCATVFFLARSPGNLPLIGLLFVAVVRCFSQQNAWPVVNITPLLTGVLLGKGIVLVLNAGSKETFRPAPVAVDFLFWLFACLAFFSTWHLGVNNIYGFQRPSGIWFDPNIFGSLMGTGLVAVVGMLVCVRKRIRLLTGRKRAFLFLFAAVMLFGLISSFSRGALLGTACGLLFLAWNYDKLKWRYVFLGTAIVAVALSCLWGRTSATAPWYVKRVDMGRFSVQNRLTAWRAGFEIMRDHPLGVGWNNALPAYEESYHPPEGGPGAIATNDYLMIGAELGIPALLCLVAYLGLCYRNNPRPVLSKMIHVGTPARLGDESPPPELAALRAACLSGALVLIVAFWFDGGLFKLPAATLFWALLELGLDPQVRTNSSGSINRPASAKTC